MSMQDTTVDFLSLSVTWSVYFKYSRTESMKMLICKFSHSFLINLLTPEFGIQILAHPVCKM